MSIYVAQETLSGNDTTILAARFRKLSKVHSKNNPIRSRG
jgi:hypothetical protein